MPSLKLPINSTFEEKNIERKEKELFSSTKHIEENAPLKEKEKNPY